MAYQNLVEFDLFVKSKYAQITTYLFNFCLYTEKPTDSIVAEVTSYGTLFQRRLQATGNAQSLMMESCV